MKKTHSYTQLHTVLKNNLAIKAKLMILTISFMLISTTKAISQPPPPTTPPPGIDVAGPIPIPILIDDTPESSDIIRFKTINNTDCELFFSSWFAIKRKDEHGNTIDMYYGGFPYNLQSNTEGVITNFQIFQMINLPELEPGETYEIAKTGVYIRFANMNDYFELYPTQHGQAIYFPGLEEPCNCFRPYFSFTSNKITLTIEPCF
ncbi:MAG: hypothetical protein ACK4K9_05420 [Bacteroidia bacterium]